MAVKGLKDREIGDRLGYSIHWVRKWIGRYKKAGIEGLRDGLRTGQSMLLTDEQIFVLYDYRTSLGISEEQFFVWKSI
ncbi:MAG: helix-turn-helix domain-containing protein [Bdellovibrionales bacterium]|nr:helix-turn-helix domain-containing protein [Bdellovibrionales bacterium]